MDPLMRQLVEALVLSRLALDRLGGAALDVHEIDRVKDLAEAAIRAAIKGELDRLLASDDKSGSAQGTSESDLPPL